MVLIQKKVSDLVRLLPQDNSKPTYFPLNPSIKIANMARKIPATAQPLDSLSTERSAKRPRSSALASDMASSTSPFTLPRLRPMTAAQMQYFESTGKHNGQQIHQQNMVNQYLDSHYTDPAKRAEAAAIAIAGFALRAFEQKEEEKKKKAEEKIQQHNNKFLRDDQVAVSRSALNLHITRIKAAKMLLEDCIQNANDESGMLMSRVRLGLMSVEEMFDSALAMKQGESPAVPYKEVEE